MVANLTRDEKVLSVSRPAEQSQHSQSDVIMRLTPWRQDANNPGIPGSKLNKYSYSVSRIIAESMNGPQSQ